MRAALTDRSFMLKLNRDIQKTTILARKFLFFQPEIAVSKLLSTALNLSMRLSVSFSNIPYTFGSLTQ